MKNIKNNMKILFRNNNILQKYPKILHDLMHSKIFYWNPVLYGGQLGSDKFSFEDLRLFYPDSVKRVV